MTLEEYIKRFVQRSDTAQRSKLISRSSLTSYSDAVKAAQNKAKRSGSKYGTRAEALKYSGLSRSGYADYIGTRANKTLENSLIAAEAERVRAEASEEIRVERERLEYKNELERAVNSIIAFARKIGREDYDEIYREASSLGYGDAWAKETTELALSSLRAQIRDDNILKARSIIVKEHLTYQQAYIYATGLGLSREDASQLAAFARRINQEVTPEEIPEEEREPIPSVGGGKTNSKPKFKDYLH